MIDQCFGKAVTGTVKVGPGVLSKLVTEASVAAEVVSCETPIAASAIATVRMAIRTMCFFMRISLPLHCGARAPAVRLFSIVMGW